MTLARARRRRRARPHDGRQRVVRPARRGTRRARACAIKACSRRCATPRSTFGSGRVIIEDAVSGALTYRELLAGARILGQRFEALSAPGEAVGLLLPNSNGVAMSLIGLLSSGRVAAMINYTAGPANVAAAIRTAIIRTVVSSRAFIAKAEPRRHRRGGRGGRRQIRLAGGCAERHLEAGEAACGAAVAPAARPRRTPTSRRSSCSPRGRKARRRRWCSPTATCSPMRARSRRALRCRPRTSCSTCCRSSTPTG